MCKGLEAWDIPKGRYLCIVTVTGSPWSWALQRAEAMQGVGREAPGQGRGRCPSATLCAGTQPTATGALQLHSSCTGLLSSLSLSLPRGLDLEWLLAFSVSSPSAAPGPFPGQPSGADGPPRTTCPQLQHGYLGRRLAGEALGGTGRAPPSAWGAPGERALQTAGSPSP